MNILRLYNTTMPIVKNTKFVQTKSVHENLGPVSWMFVTAKRVFLGLHSETRVCILDKRGGIWCQSFRNLTNVK